VNALTKLLAWVKTAPASFFEQGEADPPSSTSRPAPRASAPFSHPGVKVVDLILEQVRALEAAGLKACLVEVPPEMMSHLEDYSRQYEYKSPGNAPRKAGTLYSIMGINVKEGPQLLVYGIDDFT
jgi:hypothetical protein